MAASATTHVMVYAQANLHCAAWRALLTGQPDIVVVDVITGRGEFAALSPLKPPAVVLLDLHTPHPELIQHCASIQSDLGLLVLISSDELDIILPLLRAGATGCLSRDESVADLARALIAVGRGELVLPPTIATRALAALARGERVQEALTEPLSEREVEVLRLLARGLTNKDMAQTLILSVRTVEAHLRSIFA